MSPRSLALSMLRKQAGQMGRDFWMFTEKISLFVGVVLQIVEPGDKFIVANRPAFNDAGDHAHVWQHA